MQEYGYCRRQSETYRCKNKKWKIYKRKVTTDLNKFNNCDEKKEDDLMAKVENKPKMVSLFSGCGGLDLGFETAGFNIIWANDFDSDAQAVYKLNFGKIDGRDILDVSEDEIPDCDILTAGFPCQPFQVLEIEKGFMIPEVCCIKNVYELLKKRCQK